MLLHELVVRTARRCPGSVAIRTGEGALSYADLDASSNRAARALETLGVGRGDRVAIWLDKGGHAIAAMQGALRLGAAYVPIDPGSPASRARAIVRDCDTRAVVTTAAGAAMLREGGLARLPCLVTDGTDGPTDAAGALADGTTAERARRLGLVPEHFLSENNAYPFFETLSDLFKTGPTLTNVMDLHILLVR